MARKAPKREEDLLLERPTEGEGGEVIPQGLRFSVALPAFEGPLDLLLHLIREHKLDILDIPISLITERYLAYLEMMQSLDIDVAAEFLVMAATLAHIKSRMLLPREEHVAQDTPEEAGEDPREALVRRLLEYQKYREAGEALGARPVLGRDTFLRPPPGDDADSDDASNGDLGFAEVSVFKLVEAFDHVLKHARIKMAHQVVMDRLSLSEAILGVSEKLTALGRLGFAQLLEKRDAAGELVPLDRHRVVITFLALLEMAKLRLLRILQEEATGEIVISLRGETPMPELQGALDDYRN